MLQLLLRLAPLPCQALNQRHPHPAQRRKSPVAIKALTQRQAVATCTL